MRTELNNEVCSRLGTTLYLDIQKGKESLKASSFQQDIRGTAACMKMIMKATKGCDQLSSNDTFFDDIWFSGVKKIEEENTEGVDYCGPVKTSHKGFFLTTL